MERYLQAAQQIVDRAIVSPRLSKTVAPAEMLPAIAGAKGPRPVAVGQEAASIVAIYQDGDYDVRVGVETTEGIGKLALKIEGQTPVPLVVAAGAWRSRRRLGSWRATSAADGSCAGTAGSRVAAASVVALEGSAKIVNLAVEGKVETVSTERLVIHHRLLGMEPGDEPLQPRKAAQQILRKFVHGAFRRPVEAMEVDRFLALYDRAAERGDPFEERIKLAVKAVLVWPRFPLQDGDTAG